MNLAIFVLQLTQDDTSQWTQDSIDGSILIVMLVIMALVAAIIVLSLWRGLPKRRKSHYW